MTIGTLIRYLRGERKAIFEVARMQGGLLLGAMFVLSAGFAREYDAQDLLRRPWYLVLPLFASLLTSWLLYSLIYFVALWRAAERLRYWKTYGSFLKLYWLTAPLAWLYALPVERLLSDGAAMRVNLTLLATVSVWRVSLMIRAVSVYFGANVLAAIAIVLFFGSSIALAVLNFTPLPIFNIMGGIPLTARESVIQDAALLVGFLGVPVWGVSLVGTVAACAGGKTWRAETVDQPGETIRLQLWLLPLAALVVLLAALPFTQAEQRLRTIVEEQLQAGDIAGGLALMSQHEQDAFPPHWDPPPWLAYPDPKPPLWDVLAEIVDKPCAAWVRATYFEKLRSALSAGDVGRGPVWRSADYAEMDRAVGILERLPEMPALGDRAAHGLYELWFVEKHPRLKNRLEKLLEAAGHPVQHPPEKSPSAIGKSP